MTAQRSAQTLTAMALLAGVYATGCAGSVPTARTGLQAQQSLVGSYDKTWDAVLQLAQQSGGALVTQDRNAGVVVYSVPDQDPNTKVWGKLFMQVYLQPDPSSGGTRVHLVPKVAQPIGTGTDGLMQAQTVVGSGYLRELEGRFYANLEQLVR